MHRKKITVTNGTKVLTADWLLNSDCWERSQRRMIKPTTRLFAKSNIQKFISTSDDLFEAENEDDAKSQQSTQNSFQDSRIKLGCFGHCGSELMKLLLDETNLKCYNDSKLPRLIEAMFGKAEKKFYEKLSFSSQETESQFLSLIVEEITRKAKRVEIESLQRNIRRYLARGGEKFESTLAPRLPIYGKDDQEFFPDLCKLKF